jgi:urease subunit beta
VSDPVSDDDQPADDHPGDDHPSDDPGGVSGSNLPRRPGTGERQAPRRRFTGDRLRDDHPLVPGEILYSDEPVEINAGADVVTLRVENTGDRPIQVGSHYHFAEVNPALAFDRDAAWGRRLSILSGGSVRFEPGAAAEVELIPIGGERIVAGLRGECGGRLDD